MASCVRGERTAEGTYIGRHGFVGIAWVLQRSGRGEKRRKSRRGRTRERQPGDGNGQRIQSPECARECDVQRPWQWQWQGPCKQSRYALIVSAAGRG